MEDDDGRPSGKEVQQRKLCWSESTCPFSTIPSCCCSTLAGGNPNLPDEMMRKILKFCPHTGAGQCVAVLHKDQRIRNIIDVHILPEMTVLV